MKNNLKIKDNLFGEEIEVEGLSKLSKSKDHVAVIDGRVFSTEAGNRGMGRYVNSIIKYFYKAGYSICLVLYRSYSIKILDKDISKYLVSIKYIDIEPMIYKQEDIHINSFAIDKILNDVKAKIYLDSTPFITPAQFDITYCPVIAIAYDLIPLRYPKDYLYHPDHKNGYESGIERLRKCDSIITISQYVKKHLVKYLGINASKILIIYPDLSTEYYKQDIINESEKNGVFSIVGGHKSKNPERSFKILNDVSNIDKTISDVKICVPTLNQFKDVTTKYKLEKNNNIELLANISEELKIKYQKNARIVAHLSIEEGFGIPLLEALFLNSKVIVIETELNREILEHSGKPDNIAVFLEPITTNLSTESILQIKKLNKNSDENAFKNLKSFFIDHWDNADKIIISSCKYATVHFNNWKLKLKYCMVSNTPYNFCGVADYCSSYPTVNTYNSIVYTKDNKVKKINAFVNLKLKSYLSFPYDEKQLDLPVIFNLAFSNSLLFGVEYLEKYGKSKDIVIFHDVSYLYDLYYYYSQQNKLNEYFNNYFVNEDKSLVDIIKIILNGDKNEISRRFMQIEKLYSSAWLRDKKCKLICHTPLCLNDDFNNINLALKNSFTFVPMGIDDRTKVIESKVSESWRMKNNINKLDIVFTVVGSVTDNKYLIEVSEILTKFIVENENQGLKIYLLLCGKIADFDVYNSILQNFSQRGIIERLLHITPNEEVTLDHIIVASDVVISLRKQNRIQMSHSFVRALSLGKPIISTDFTGFYTINEKSSLLSKTIYGSFSKYFSILKENRRNLIKLAKESRKIYDDNHNINKNLNIILSVNHEK